MMEAEDLNRPLLARVVQARDGVGERAWRPLAVRGKPVSLAALKPLEDGGGLVLRAYEPEGGRGEVSVGLPDGWSVGAALDLLERPSGEPAQTDFSPFQVRSWRLMPPG